VHAYTGITMWRDATEEQPGAGRLINYSKCHANVRKTHLYTQSLLYCQPHITLKCRIFWRETISFALS